MLAKRFLAIPIVIWIVTSLWGVACLRHEKLAFGFMQILPEKLLREDLLKSIFFLHIQPPLLNFIYGVCLKLSNHPEIVFSFLNHFCSLGIIFYFFNLLRIFSFSSKTAAIIVTLWVLNPSFLLFQNDVMYEQFVMFTIVAALFHGCSAVSSEKNYHLLACFAFICLATLTRSMIHPILYLFFFLVLILGVWLKKYRIGAFMAMQLPWTLILILFILKNILLFDVWGLSSFQGLSLLRMADFGISTEEKIQMVQQEGFHPIFSLDGHPRRCLYLLQEQPLINTYAHPSLSEKELEGTFNFNHSCMLTYNKVATTMAKRLFREKRERYLEAVSTARSIFLWPSTTYTFFSENSKRVMIWDNIFQTFVYGNQGPSYMNYKENNIFDLSFFPKLIYRKFFDNEGLIRFSVSVAMVYMPLRIIAGLLVQGISPFIVQQLLVTGTALFVSLVAILTEHGENQRFRYTIEPLFWILFLVYIRDVFRIVNSLLIVINRRRREARRSPNTKI